MAPIPPITLKAMWDGTELTAGAAESQAAIQAIGTTATTELGTTLPAAADASAVALSTKATKFKAVGTSLGESVAGGISGGLSAPAALASTASAATGLLAPLAATGAGAVAAVGIGLGLAVVSNMIKGVAEKRQAFTDSINELFSSLEITARSTGRQIQKEILQGFDFTAVIEQVGGADGFAGGMAKVNAIVEDTGASFTTVVRALQGEVNPQTDALLETLIKAKDQGQLLSDGFFENRFLMNDTAKNADDLLGAITSTREKQADLTGYAKQARDYMQATAGHASVTANETARAADQASRLAENLSNVARNANIRVDVGV